VSSRDRFRADPSASSATSGKDAATPQPGDSTKTLREGTHAADPSGRFGACVIRTPTIRRDESGRMIAHPAEDDPTFHARTNYTRG
jgi:hypothetical protein